MKKAAPGDQAKQYQMMRAAYEKMHKALQATGRPIYFSLCQYGWDSVWKWGPTVGGNSWRTTDDIQDNYMSMSNIGFSQAGLSKYAAPGHWNDPDMLEVGNGKMKYNEYLTHMSLWAILAAPLLAGNDLSDVRGNQIHPPQQGRHRHRPGPARQAGRSPQCRTAPSSSGPNP